MTKALEKTVEEDTHVAQTDVTLMGNDASEQNMSRFPSITHLLDMEYLGSISQLLCDNNSYNTTFDFQNTIGNAGIDNNAEKPQLGEIPYQDMDSGNIFSQPMVVNPVYDIRGFGS